MADRLRLAALVGDEREGVERQTLAIDVVDAQAMLLREAGVRVVVLEVEDADRQPQIGGGGDEHLQHLRLAGPGIAGDEDPEVVERSLLLIRLPEDLRAGRSAPNQHPDRAPGRRGRYGGLRERGGLLPRLGLGRLILRSFRLPSTP